MVHTTGASLHQKTPAKAPPSFPPAASIDATPIPNDVGSRLSTVLGRFCGGSVHIYRVTLVYVTRTWTPPATLAEVESANYVCFLCAFLVAMESYYAVGYTVRQLRRFGSEPSLRSVTPLWSAHAVADGLLPRAAAEGNPTCDPPDVIAGSPSGVRTGEASQLGHFGRMAGTDDADDHNFDSGQRSPTAGDEEDGVVPMSRLARYRNALWRSLTPLSTRSSLTGMRDGHDESHGDSAAARQLRSRGDSSAKCKTVPDSMLPRGLMGELHHDAALSVVPSQTAQYEALKTVTQCNVDTPSHNPLAAGGVFGAREVEDADGDDDEEQSWEATPEMLKHYWKQLERSILTAPRRAPAQVWRSLPDDMSSNEPDLQAVEAWCDEVMCRALHHEKLSPSWSAWVSALLQGRTAVKRASSAGMYGRVHRPVFAVPPGGCFIYRTKPNLDEFVATDEDDDEGDADQGGEGFEKVEEGGSGEVFVGDTAPSVVGAPPPRRGDHAGTGAAMASAGTHPGETPAPRAPRRGKPRLPRSPLAPRTPLKRRRELKWEALFLIWFNVVEVSISSREIRALLLKASPPAFLSPAMTQGNGPTDLDVASSNLGLLWLWSTVQHVFDTLVADKDVEKCEKDIEELAAYMAPLFNKCIARWPSPAAMAASSEVALSSGLVEMICGAQAAWVSLNTVLRKLLSLRRRLYVRNTWSLARYMYANSKAKLLSAVLITFMMTLSSRVSVAGRQVRERIAAYVERSEATNNGGSVSATPSYITGMCAFELVRLAVQFVISNVTSEFIALTASQRREIVKMQLYEALSHTELSFFEQHTYEEVEEILCYVSDMEGIDVQLHQFLFDAINTLVSLYYTLSPFSCRSRCVAAAVALAPYALRGIAAAVESRYLLLQREGYLPSAAYAAGDELQGGDEDGNVLREGAMLRGEEIIAAIPQLRPYGADVRFVHWWNRHQQRRQRLQMAHRTRVMRGATVRAGGRDSVGSPAGSPPSAREGAALSLSLSPTPPPMGGRRSHGDGLSGTTPPSWTDRARDRLGPWITDEDVSLIRSALFALLQLPHGKLLPGIGKAVLDLTEWLLPMVAATNGLAWCAQSDLDCFQLLEGTQALDAAIHTIIEALDTAEMVGYNAYKASMLERLLQPMRWEMISLEEEAYVTNFTVSADVIREAADARLRSLRCASPVTRVASPSRLPAIFPPSPSTGLLATVTEARSSLFYRHHRLHIIEVRRVQLRYWLPEQRRDTERRRRSSVTPSAATTAPDAASAALIERQRTNSPTGTSVTSSSDHFGVRNASVTRVFDSERENDNGDADDADAVEGSLVFTHDIQLWCPSQRRGRFVCVTGPNGAGKTAFVHLLLALHLNTTGIPPSSATTASHPRLMRCGTVTFCFAPRRQIRRSRRGLFLSRTYANGLRGGRGGGSGVGSALEESRRRRGGAANSNLLRARTAANVVGQGRGGVPCEMDASAEVSELQLSRSYPTLSTAAGERDDREGVVNDEASDAHRARKGASASLGLPPGANVDDATHSAQVDTRVDLRAIPADVLRRHIFSYVPETPTLFPGATVAQNISLVGYVSVATDAVMRRVLQCAALAQCDFVHQLPLGLLTRVSDSTGNAWSTTAPYSTGGGSTSVTRLSVDQAKRLMLARAYFHGGEVLLLDEPTKDIQETATSLKLYEGWRQLLHSGHLSGVICATVDEALLRVADEVIQLP